MINIFDLYCLESVFLNVHCLMDLKYMHEIINGLKNSHCFFLILMVLLSINRDFFQDYNNHLTLMVFICHCVGRDF